MNMMMLLLQSIHAFVFQITAQRLLCLALNIYPFIYPMYNILGLVSVMFCRYLSLIYATQILSTLCLYNQNYIYSNFNQVCWYTALYLL